MPGIRDAPKNPRALAHQATDDGLKPGNFLGALYPCAKAPGY